MDNSTLEGKMEEASRRCLLKQIVLPGCKRSRCWVCCLFVITTATTFLFFKGQSFLHMEFVMTNVLKIDANFSSAFNFNESQQTQEFKVVCMILTTLLNWETRGKAVKNTWAKRCHKAIFFYTRIPDCSSEPICNESNAVGLNVPDGRDHLTAKTLGALNYSYVTYGSDADYFLKADDDTYVIAENLQRILSQLNSIPLLYLGKLLRGELPNGYNSGGAGYVISNQAAKLLVENRTLYPDACQGDGGFEDVEIGRCLAKFGIYSHDTMDSSGKQMFHSENPSHVIQSVKDGPGTYSFVNINGAEFGNKNAERGHMLSNWTATMHYVSPSEMYMYEFLLYHLRRRDVVAQTDT